MKKMSRVLFIAQELYRASSGGDDYDFIEDPYGWADLMFKDKARAAIRAYKQYDRIQNLQAKK